MLGQTGWREWPPSSLGTDEHELLARVGDSIRLQILHTVDYRQALANPGSADERRHGRDLSRAIARDVPVARDLASNLLDTVDRLSSARDPAAARPRRRRLGDASGCRRRCRAVRRRPSPPVRSSARRRTRSVAPVSCSACA